MSDVAWIKVPNAVMSANLHNRSDVETRIVDGQLQWRFRTKDEAEEIARLLVKYTPAELAGLVWHLQNECLEFYQAVGFLADKFGFWDEAADEEKCVQLNKLLDNIDNAVGLEAKTHHDLLPFGWPDEEIG